jgi:hypothetical protein
MPCFSGRSEHVLLKKDCVSGCACCYNHTYSCGLLKCDEQKDNTSLPDVSALVCDLLNGLLNDGVNCEQLLDDLNLESLPEKHCRVVITINNLSTLSSDTVVIENRELSTTILSVITGDVLVYLVNGVECLRCTVS